MNKQSSPRRKSVLSGCTEFCATAARLISDLQMILIVRPIQFGEQKGLLSQEYPCKGYAVSTLGHELGGMQSIAMKGISSTASTSSADTECPSPIPTTCGRQCNTFSREANDEDCPRTTHGWPNDQWRPTYVPCTPGALVFSVTQDEQLSAWRLRRESSRSSSAFKPEY